jgi:hypothetical protein
MPWNAAYKSKWKAFLAALNSQVQQEPSSSAFVSINMAGPTASSTEMILPNQDDQGAYETGGFLYLKTGAGGVVPKGESAIGVTVPTAWNMLFENFYGSSVTNTDGPFIAEWDSAIETYSQIFSGVTLVLTTSSDGLPSFPAAASSLRVAAPGFDSDCDDPPSAGHAMACAAVTEVLTYFTNPTVGGKNAKAVFEAGMTASRAGAVDLGENGVKWLAWSTEAGKTPLPGTKYDMSQIMGGIQFATAFSPAANLQLEGCPTYPTVCAGLTPSAGLRYVMELSYFDGTDGGPVWGSSVEVSHGNFQYYNAPMNYLEVYDTDIVYASGLTGCSFEAIAGNPAKSIPPDVTACEVQPTSPTFGDVQTTQEELQLSNDILLAIAEPSDLP